MRLAQTFLKPIVKPVLKPLLYSRFGVGPAVLSQLNARPGIIKHVPAEQRGRIGYRSSAAAVAGYIPHRGRLDPHQHRNRRGITLGGWPAPSLVRWRAADGRPRVCGTGYRVDLSKYAFLDADLVRSIECVGGYPQLSKTFETTLPGLHIAGAPGGATRSP